MFFGYILEQGGHTTSSGSFHPVTNDQMQGRERVPLDAKVWFEVPSYALKTYWHPYFNDAFPPYAIIPDVRIPWFMLGVIYTGLFFLLADRKERR